MFAACQIIGAIVLVGAISMLDYGLLTPSETPVSRVGRCPLLAQSGHARVHCKSPLSGVKRTLLGSLFGCASRDYPTF